MAETVGYGFEEEKARTLSRMADEFRLKGKRSKYSYPEPLNQGGLGSGFELVQVKDDLGVETQWDGYLVSSESGGYHLGQVVRWEVPLGGTQPYLVSYGDCWVKFLDWEQIDHEEPFSIAEYNRVYGPMRLMGTYSASISVGARAGEVLEAPLFAGTLGEQTFLAVAKQPDKASPSDPDVTQIESGEWAEFELWHVDSSHDDEEGSEEDEKDSGLTLFALVRGAPVATKNEASSDVNEQKFSIVSRLRGGRRYAAPYTCP